MQRLAWPAGGIADAHQPHVKTRAAGAKPALQRAAESSDEMAKYHRRCGAWPDRQTGTKPTVREAPLVEEEPSVKSHFAAAPALLVPAQYRPVAVGERVTRGQCVAVPAGALGAPIHASIGGVVSTISDTVVEVNHVSGYRNFRTHQHRRGMELSDAMLKAPTLICWSVRPSAVSFTDAGRRYRHAYPAGH